MTAETFLNGRVFLHCGDSRAVLKTLADNSIDSIVTDPPYALVSIVKRFGGANAAACKIPEGGSGAYARASAGFMGQAWDTGETAFAVDFWAECLRVLKPGGHLVASSGTRTYHRLEAAPAVREMVRAGEVSATTAVNVTRKHGADAEATLIKAKGHATGAGKTRVTAAHVAAATGEFQATAANAKIMIGALHQIVDDGDDFSSLLAEETLRSVGALKPGVASRQHVATAEAAAE
ncbi:MAG: Adenine-specific methyltransferase [Rhizobium sp.]|nr:Adenine-specific methyltransferase [Rhizobium sp.]